MRSRVLACRAARPRVVAGCKEEGTVTVHRLDVQGRQGRRRSAAAEPRSPRARARQLPWGRKTYFDRSRFDADLKRIQAFYADRGYPDARVTGFDVKLNDKQDAVDVTVTIAEGEPVKVAAIDFVGFDVDPGRRISTQLMKQAFRSRSARRATGSWSSRRTRWRSTSCAITAIPYAKVATAEDDGPDGKNATLTFTAEPGKLAHFGPVEISGQQDASATASSSAS